MHADKVAGALLHEIALTWDAINRNHFRGALRPPVFAWTDAPGQRPGGAGRLGEWRPASREIRLSRRLAFDGPWLALVEVLKHEMAHQYAHEVLKAVDETAHGPAFREVCRRMGVDAAAAGVVPATASDADRILRKIRGLLALADSPNLHEAQAAMEAAQRLMLRHNLAALDAAEARTFAVRQLGRPRLRHSTAERVLAGILATHFFVRAIWIPAFVVDRARSGRVLEISGTAENLDLAEYVHAWLRETADRLWREHLLAHPATRRATEKLRFQVGVMDGFADSLARGASVSAGHGLVWVGDAELDTWVGQRHPHLRSVRSRVVISDGYHHGRAAGRDIVLNKPVSAAPTGGTRLLTGHPTRS
jgi:hypothetical protein